MEDNNRDAFEELWHENRYRLLREDAEYRQVADSYKIKSGVDILLFGLPVVVGVVFIDHAPIERELLRWLACAAAVVVTFVLCVWVKSLIAGTRSAAEVEKDVKERCYKRYCECGRLENDE